MSDTDTEADSGPLVDAAPDDGGSSARAVALGLLDTVLRGRIALALALARHPQLRDLDSRDRAFARLLVATVLRRLPQIDALIDQCLEKPLPKRAGTVRDMLRLGAAQLLFVGTPAHAAVSETVALAAASGHARMAGLINAVMRRLTREGVGWTAEQDAPRLNTPDWLWTSWSANYGDATAREIAAAHLADPPLDLTAHADPEAWAERLGAEMLPTGSLRRSRAGDVAAMPGYDDGAWWVQDAAAALPVRLLENVAGRRIADLCAAPGGKTAQLAAMGAKVIAVDRSAPRMALLEANLARLGLSAETVIADAAAWRPDGPVDAVLLDAPCSSTGTARRHPDILRLKTAKDVASLVAVQDRLLAAAVEMLVPGGRLIYCTCSLQSEEGPDRIAALLANDAHVARDPVRRGEIAGADEFITDQGDLRTLPNGWAARGGLDGFYAARLVRL